MLHHPTLDKLQSLRLRGMYHALVEQMQMPEIAPLTFEERLGLLVDREYTEREERRLTTRLRQAKLRQAACLEDLDYRQPRGLEKSLMTMLATCQWIRDRHNVLITGPTGIGKTWIACALGQKACRDGFTVLYLRLPRLLQEWPIAKGDGRYGKLMATLAKTDVLILDDWGLATLNDENRRDLLNCWKIATTAAPRSSRANSPSSTGMRLLEIRRSPMPSSIVWSTTRIKFHYKENPCANSRPG